MDSLGAWQTFVEYQTTLTRMRRRVIRRLVRVKTVCHWMPIPLLLVSSVHGLMIFGVIV